MHCLYRWCGVCPTDELAPEVHTVAPAEPMTDDDLCLGIAASLLGQVQDLTIKPHRVIIQHRPYVLQRADIVDLHARRRISPWLRKSPVTPATLILGDMSIQGNLKGIKSLTEPLQLGMDNGAKRAMIPIENKRNFLEVSADIVERVDPVFFGDPKQAAMKALGLT